MHTGPARIWGWWRQGRGGGIRRSLRVLERIAVATERQAEALERLAHAWAPTPPAETDPPQGTIDYVDVEGVVEAQRYRRQLWVELGRQPSDAEIAAHLDTWAEHTGRTVPPTGDA